MTNRQKQWQLYYLGFLDSIEDVDGIWGPKSEKATTRLQDVFSINIDGVFGSHTRNLTKSVIDNIQDVVTRYADTPLVNDGLAGPATMAATAKYQEAMGLPPTGIADAATRELILNTFAPVPQEKAEQGSWWDEIEYFSRDELKCKCGGRYCDGFPAEPQEMVVRLADRARKHFGKPAYNVSFLRCSTWNALSGGVANSQHMYGEAMDICIPGVTANDLYSFLKKQPEVRYTYKINNTNVHFDIQKGKR